MSLPKHQKEVLKNCCICGDQKLFNSIINTYLLTEDEMVEVFQVAVKNKSLAIIGDMFEHYSNKYQNKFLNLAYTQILEQANGEVGSHTPVQFLMSHKKYRKDKSGKMAVRIRHLMQSACKSGDIEAVKFYLDLIAYKKTTGSASVNFILEKILKNTYFDEECELALSNCLTTSVHENLYPMFEFLYDYTYKNLNQEDLVNAFSTMCTFGDRKAFDFAFNYNKERNIVFSQKEHQDFFLYRMNTYTAENLDMLSCIFNNFKIDLNYNRDEIFKAMIKNGDKEIAKFLILDLKMPITKEVKSLLKMHETLNSGDLFLFINSLFSKRELNLEIKTGDKVGRHKTHKI